MHVQVTEIGRHCVRLAFSDSINYCICVCCIKNTYVWKDRGRWVSVHLISGRLVKVDYRLDRLSKLSCSLHKLTFLAFLKGPIPTLSTTLALAGTTYDTTLVGSRLWARARIRVNGMKSAIHQLRLSTGRLPLPVRFRRSTRAWCQPKTSAF